MSCLINKEYNIYNILTKGEKLNNNIFIHSEQIVKINDGYILLYNISDKEYDSYNPHLVICDNDLIVQGAGYFASEFIDSVINDTIIAALNKHRINRAHAYTNDLPTNIYLSYYTPEIDNGYGNIHNIIVDSLEYFSQNFTVRLYIRTSDDSYAWKGKEHYKKDTSYYKNNFSIKKAIDLPISKLHFNKYNRDIISTLYHTNYGRSWNEMAVLNETILIDLFNNIWNDINKQ